MVDEMLEIFDENSFDDFWFHDQQYRSLAFEEANDFPVLFQSFKIFLPHILCIFRPISHVSVFSFLCF